MDVAVFHPGTQHSWQTALALQQLGRLRWYATSLFYDPARWPYRIERLLPGPLGARAGAEFRRFHHAGIDPALVRTTGAVEWFERIAARAGMPRLARGLDRIGNRRFVRGIADSVASRELFALWGFNGSSRGTFELARKHGRTCILDRTIGDARAYNLAMASLQQRYAEWFTATERAIPEAMIRDEQAEYELADAIVVGSDHAAGTVRQFGGPDVARKVRVLPYCFDEALFGLQPPPQPVPREGPLRFLFVGQISPRKGVHHLLEAIERIAPDEARLTLVGELRVPSRIFARYSGRIEHIPSVPRAAIPAIMARHHVLVYPSYFEGSSLALLEALASGLGIIQSRAAGNGATEHCGIVLDEPGTDALEAAMRAAIADRNRVDAWRAAAQAEASRYKFDAYRDNIAALLAAMGL